MVPPVGIKSFILSFKFNDLKDIQLPIVARAVLQIVAQIWQDEPMKGVGSKTDVSCRHRQQR